MKKNLLRNCLLIVVLCLFFGKMLFAEKNEFPPFHIDKISPGDKLVLFEFNDLEGQTWTNKTPLFRPIIFITGNWQLRHDLKKWGNYLSLRYNPVVDIIWLFNPNGTEFSEHKSEVEKNFNNFVSPVPIVIDDHSLIGRSLRIDYRIPSIIGITNSNRLAFVYHSPLNTIAREEINSLIFTKLLTDRQR
jgi:hypothetical protein